MTQQYVGTKIVTAWPEERDGRPGYAVKYADGYTSWSPAEAFDAAYVALGQIDHLPLYVQRLYAEFGELQTRLTKLHAFLNGDEFGKLAQRDQELMVLQARLMIDYVNILVERIERATPATEAAEQAEGETLENPAA